MQTLNLHLRALCLSVCLSLAVCPMLAAQLGGNPEAAQDDIFVLPYGTNAFPIQIQALLANDAAGQIVAVSDVSFGTVQDGLPTTVTYLPGPNFAAQGLDVFTYTLQTVTGDETAQVYLVPEKEGTLFLEETFDNGLSEAWTETSESGNMVFVEDPADTGNLSLLVDLESESELFLRYRHPIQGDGHSSTRVRVVIEPDGVQANEFFTIASASDPQDDPVWRIDLRTESGIRQTRAATWVQGVEQVTPWISLPAGRNIVILDWWAAEVPGASSGGVMFRLAGEVVADLTGLANAETLVSTITLEPSGVPPGTTGSYLMDGIYFWDEITPLYKPLFADGLEQGTFQAWDATVIAERLAITEDAALSGDHGLEILAKIDVGQEYLEDVFEGERTHYRVRFQLDLNTLQIPVGGHLRLLRGIDDQGQAPFTLRLRNLSGQPYLEAKVLEGSGPTSWTTPLPTAPGAFTVQLQWWTSTDAVQPNGGLRLWLDGVPVLQRLALDNEDCGLASVRLGAMGYTAGTLGVLYVDDFASWD